MSEIGKALRTNTSLKTLYLDSNQVADVVELCEGLRLNRTLERLSLGDNLISEEDKSYLQQAKSGVLRRLYI